MLFKEFVAKNQGDRENEKVLSFGIDFLDEALGGLSKSDILVLGGRTGNGKTQVATQIALHTARQTKDVFVYSLESEKNEIEMRILHSELMRRFYSLPNHERPLINTRYVNWRHGKLSNVDVIKKLENEIANDSQFGMDMAGLNVWYRDGQFTVDDFCRGLIDLEKYAKLIILDHFHFFDWDDKSEYDALRKAIKKIRDTALKHQVPIILLAHLRKASSFNKTVIPEIDDFHGSSDLTKIATQVVLVSKADGETTSGSRPTYFYIPKARAAGDAAGFVGVAGYNMKTGRYEPGYMLGRAKFGDVELITDPKQCPRWATKVKFSSGESL